MNTYRQIGELNDLAYAKAAEVDPPGDDALWDHGTQAVDKLMGTRSKSGSTTDSQLFIDLDNVQEIGEVCNVAQSLSHNTEPNEQVLVSYNKTPARCIKAIAEHF